MDSAGTVAGTVSGRLQLTFERRGKRTVLAHSYAEPPFRVGPAIDVDGAAYLILVCAGPGVFGGDELRQSIHVARGARVVLTSQSALQVHPAPGSDLDLLVDGPRENRDLTPIITQDFRVDEDGELIADWDPIIPFAGARLDQCISIALAPGARMLWSDALMSGRAGRGESWRFASVAHELAVRIDGVLAYLERYRLGSAREATRRWMAGRADYAGTVLVAHPDATAATATSLGTALHSMSVEGTSAAVDCVQDGLLLARLLSTSGPRFAAAREAARTGILEAIFGRPAGVKRK
jgi:urease accessory protein UreH